MTTDDKIGEKSLQYDSNRDATKISALLSGKSFNPDNLIYKYKVEGRTPKDFRIYQNPIKLFKNLKDGNVNPREVLKSQNSFRSDLGKIRKGNPDLKSEEQISVIQNVENVFDLREKIIDFFNNFSFLLSEAKTKQNTTKKTQNFNS